MQLHKLIQTKFNCTYLILILFDKIMLNISLHLSALSPEMPLCRTVGGTANPKHFWSSSAKGSSKKFSSEIPNSQWFCLGFNIEFKTQENHSLIYLSTRCILRAIHTEYYSESRQEAHAILSIRDQSVRCNPPEFQSNQSNKCCKNVTNSIFSC